MTKAYTVHIRDKAKREPEHEQTFDRFDTLYAFVKGIERNNSSDVINVHLPKHATVKERERIMALGYRVH